MVSPERGPTHLPSPSAEITSWDVPWQHLGCAPPDSGSAPAATHCSSKRLLPVPLLGWQHPGWGSVATARLAAPTESWHWLKDPCQPGRWVQQPWEGTVLLLWHIPAGSAGSSGRCHSRRPRFLQHCPCQCNSFSPANPFLFNMQKIFPICSNLGCEFPCSCQHILCRDSCVQVFTYWVFGSSTSSGKS